MNRFTVIQKFLAWYYDKIKYRTYSPNQRKGLSAFEFGFRARKELDSIIPVLMKLNLKRVRAIYEEDYASVRLIDDSIKSMQNDYDNALKELDDMDKLMWRTVFLDFVRNHDNETCNRVWNVPMEELVKLRELLGKKNNKSS